jgi:hypothetical protein
MNMRNALDEAHYSQLKHVTTAYRTTTTIQILEHLETRWCPLKPQSSFWSFMPIGTAR